MPAVRGQGAARANGTDNESKVAIRKRAAEQSHNSASISRASRCRTATGSCRYFRERPIQSGGQENRRTKIRSEDRSEGGSNPTICHIPTTSYIERPAFLCSAQLSHGGECQPVAAPHGRTEIQIGGAQPVRLYRDCLV